MNNRLESLTCPKCGATVDFLPCETEEFLCEYCGSLIRLTREPQPYINVNITEDFQQITPGQVMQRVGRLFYLCKDEQAKSLLEKALVYFPNNPRLLELENQCDCFLTRDMGNYLRMLSVRTFLSQDECARYRTEIDGFCKMVGNNAVNALNFPRLRKQSVDNYQAILRYIADLKKCLHNEAIIHSDRLYESVKLAVLKLSAIVCNTIYIQNTRFPRQYVMLIDFKLRRKIKADFDAIESFGDTEYEIVDESVVRQYISGGRYE